MNIMQLPKFSLYGVNNMLDNSFTHWIDIISINKLTVQYVESIYISDKSILKLVKLRFSNGTISVINYVSNMIQ